MLMLNLRTKLMRLLLLWLWWLLLLLRRQRRRRRSMEISVGLFVMYTILIV